MNEFFSTFNLSTLHALIFDNKFVFTVVLFLMFFLLKKLLIKTIKHKSKSDKSDKKIKINMVNNIFTLLIIVALFNTWSHEIQKFAFSIAAFVVAIVLATREFIQCFIGFLYLISSRPFRIGDWIQIGNYFGEVHSTDWAKLTLLEVNKDDYYCDDFKDVAIRYNQLIENRLEINIAGPEPHIQIATSEIGDTEVLFTIFCPTEQALEIEQKLTQDFMYLWFEQKSLALVSKD